MTSSHSLTALLLSATLSLTFSAHAQTTPTNLGAATTTLDTSEQSLRYKAAHDSLMRQVRAVRNQATARSSGFKAKKGSLGGLRRRVIAYAGTPTPTIANNSVGRFSPLVMRETIKHRFGIELKKVVYYDEKKRVVLQERYVGQQLTRLELFEYTKAFNSPTASWLFVRGDYLRRLSSPVVSLAYKSNRQESYFFSPRPANE